MKKIIILLLCCGALIGMVGCGGTTALPPTESLQTTVSETAVTETQPAMAVEPTEKEKEKETVYIESHEQASEPTPTTPTAMVKSTEIIKPTEATNTSEEKGVSQVVDTVTNTISQNTENETTVAELTKETVSEHETIQAEFDIQNWISFAKEYAVSVGLTLDSEAMSCWDNPIGAGEHCIYLERDIKSRLKRYAKDDDITDVWIWAKPAGSDCYNIYIGYA